LAVRLRLRRVGRKKLPVYKVVAADRRSPRDGRYIEAVGQYEPLRPSNNVEFNEDRVMYWLQNGALPTDTVRNLLKSKGLWLKWSLMKKGADDETITQEVEKFIELRAEKEQKAQDTTVKKKEEKPVEAEEPEAVQTEEPAIPEEKQSSPEQTTETVEDKKQAQDNTETTSSPEKTQGEQNENTEKKE